MSRQLQNKRILITGASSGIGRCLAEKLSKLGARLVLTARREDKLRELADGLPGETLIVPGDITVEADRQRLLDQAVEHFGGLDVIINNAGISSWAHFADSTEEILRKIMEVNFFAPTELMRSAIPILTNGDQPAIVNISSKCGRRALPAWPEYSAAKFALTGQAEALRAELARFDIDVLTIFPGLTKSELKHNLLLNQGKLKVDFDQKGMPTEQVADAIVASLQSNRAETVVGKDARWLLRINKFFPRLVDYLVARKVKKLYAAPN